MHEKFEPIFDFTISDWDYLAIMGIGVLAPIGKLDVLSLIYRDGKIKAINRILFPSGNKVKFELKKHYKSVDETIDGIRDTVSKFPRAEISGEHIIYNTTTKAKDLIELVHKHPGFIVNTTDM